MPNNVQILREARRRINGKPSVARRGSVRAGDHGPGPTWAFARIRSNTEPTGDTTGDGLIFRYRLQLHFPVRFAEGPTVRLSSWREWNIALTQPEIVPGHLGAWGSEVCYVRRIICQIGEVAVHPSRFLRDGPTLSVPVWASPSPVRGHAS